MLTLANNHFRDYGECGVDETIKECERLNVAYVGAVLRNQRNLFS